jgi:histidinol-phosphatase (PHP family)
LAQFELDYVIGSVHYLDDWMFDHPDYKETYKQWDNDELYEEYFDCITQAVKTGLFDIIGHFDLIKVFNVRPNKDILELVNPVLEVIKKHDQVIEINTNGLNKPVGEIYPERKILERAKELGIKVTLGSDAHSADRVGENLAKVRELLSDIGYKEFATFSGRERKMVDL